MYYYKICMTSGKEYNIVSDLKVKELFEKIFPDDIVGKHFSSFKLANSDKQEVAILADEISSIEFITESR